jgi:putative nucleotidyltransferase with HDIG domain
MILLKIFVGGLMFHHFEGKELNRVEGIQQLIIKEILASEKLDDSESSKTWELKHSSGVIQMARLLAEKRGIDTELAVVAASLHDISTIQSGSYDEHASRGAVIAKEILEKTKLFSDQEITTICKMIAEHSNKHLYSDNKLVELMKDADTLDCFLYDKNIYDEKPPEKLKEYLKRFIALRQELNLPADDYFAERLKEIE